jgi:hypothetical protein
MRVTNCRCILTLVFLVLSISDKAASQTSDSQTEVWPKLSATFDLDAKTRLQVFGGTQNGSDFQWYAGTIVSRRMKRLVMRRVKDVDEENEHLIVVGAGYEYLQTLENNKIKRESRIIFQGTGNKSPGAGFLVTNRNRLEFRWVNGAYNFRYRNKLTVDRAFKVSGFRFTPYGSGELFWDRNHHSWNQNEYSLGVQLPYKQLLKLDAFYLHQNCTTCNQQHVNVFGLTLNFYFNRK